MLRMAHRILSQELHTVVLNGRSQRDEPSMKPIVKAAIAKSQIIIADNVAEFVASSPDKLWGTDSFPYLVPPFPFTFIEYKVCNPTFSQIGVLLSVDDPSSFKRWRWKSDVKWVVTVVMFGSLNGQAVMMDDHLAFGVRVDGSMSEVYGESEMWCPAIIPAFLAVSFMHCKGVRKTEDTSMQPPAKWTRRAKAPQLKFHVLEINPFKEVLRSEGGSESNGLKKALHICRGHFATYTEEKPLFGHIVGTVWKPSHVRGDIKAGAVVKDYAVSPE